MSEEEGELSDASNDQITSAFDELNLNEDPISEEEWEKLVCALFNGACLTEIPRLILSILKVNAAGEFPPKPPYRYLIRHLTAAFGVRESNGEIESVCFNGDKHTHAENNVIAHYSDPDSCNLRSIDISYSPCAEKKCSPYPCPRECKGCAETIIKHFGVLPPESRPVIRFAWVLGCPVRSPAAQALFNQSKKAIRSLVVNKDKTGKEIPGFEVEVWNTELVRRYLISHAPETMPNCMELIKALALESVTRALQERDDETEGLIKRIIDFENMREEVKEEAWKAGWALYWEEKAKRDADEKKKRDAEEEKKKRDADEKKRDADEKKKKGLEEKEVRRKQAPKTKRQVTGGLKK